MLHVCNHEEEINEEEIEELQTKSIAEYVKERREKSAERNKEYEEKINELKEKAKKLKGE